MTKDALLSACEDLKACADQISANNTEAEVAYDPFQGSKVEVVEGHISAHGLILAQAAMEGLKYALADVPRIKVSEISFHLHFSGEDVTVEVKFCKKFSWISVLDPDRRQSLYANLSLFRERMVWIDQSCTSGAERNLYWVKAQNDNGTATHHNIRATSAGEAVRLLAALRRQFDDPDTMLASVVSVYQFISKQDWGPNTSCVSENGNPATISSDTQPDFP